MAVEEFMNEYNVLVEPACGAAIAYGYDQSVNVKPDEKILIIACGGVGLDFRKFQEYQSKLYRWSVLKVLVSLIIRRKAFL